MQPFTPTLVETHYNSIRKIVETEILDKAW